MSFSYWFVFAGLLLTIMALGETVLKRLPLSTALLYLAAGVVAGPAVMGLLVFDPLGEEGAPILERLAEVAVIISLFSAGLKMRRPVFDRCWLLPARLAFISMSVTVGLIALVGVFLLDLPLGAAVLLGAVLAPTDPVLASDVSVQHAADDDRLRFALTGEAGLNDGTAFPFVYLGLGLLGLHELGAFGWRWFAVDVVYAIAGGLAIGGVMGWGTSKLVLYLRRRHKEAVGADDFLALGLIALSYGVALVAGTWAFLAAFAAGVALRAVERTESADAGRPDPDVKAAAGAEMQETASNPEDAPAYMASAVLGFSEQLERIAAVAMVVVVGALLLAYTDWDYAAIWFVPLVLLVIRPISVWIGLLGDPSKAVQKGLVGWFGIRGIGSVYYLAYAVNAGLPEGAGAAILSLTLATIATSAVVHGVSVTPLMNWYRRREERGDSQPQPT